jgi:hypothetical protein
MSDRDNNPDLGRSGGSKSGEDRTGDQSNQNSEWLRDQVGEDHNLSGSSTYRTLPDQPEGEQNDQDSGSRDAADRQSNR